MAALKTNDDLESTLMYALEYLGRDGRAPLTSEQWALLAQELGRAKDYAEKCMRLRAKLEGKPDAPA